MTTKKAINLVHLGMFLAVCLWDITSCQGSTAWFGTKGILYKCHCDNDNCDSNGTCIGSSRCTSGWFGPACQYLDLLQTNSSQETPSWLNDNDATTCNTDQNSQTLTITLQDVFYFTWLRLHVNTSGISLNYKVHFNSTIDGQSTECTNMTRAHVNGTVSDIHCDPGVLFQQLILTGDGVPFLCSLYISGGRNVALKQYTNQTSRIYYQSYSTSPDNAVDGNINSELDNGSCTHTTDSPLPQTWTLQFIRPQQVNRYVIFNRDKLQEKLNGFVLQAKTRDGTPTFYYTATKPNQSTYDFWSNSLTGVFSVTITVYNFLTLCEVEMFGDTICAVGSYGRECDQYCNCATQSDKCYVSTGGCPSGCAPGYYGEDCQLTCRATFFGIDCAEKCSVNCTGQSCDAKNGTCYLCVAGTKGQKCESECEPKRYGLNCTEMCSTNCDGELCNAKTGICNSCVAGKMGEMCNQTCDPTFYGINCRQECSATCSNHYCNSTNGHCFSCTIGTQGPKCESDCDPIYYGDKCALKCSDNCKAQLCNAISGICQSCKPGRTGQLCDQECNETYFGENCAYICSSNCQNRLCSQTDGVCVSCVAGRSGPFCDPGSEVGAPPVGAIIGAVVGFVVLATLIVVGIIIWRRHKGKHNGYSDEHNVENVDEVKYENAELALTSVAPKPPNYLPNKQKHSVRDKPNLSPNNTYYNNQQPTADGTYYNIGLELSDTSISAQNLNTFMSSHTKEYFQTQFTSIPANTLATTTVALSPQNQHKNRYKNISAYDHSRVHLQADSKKKHGDYINASYINGYKRQKKYIASQGPTKTILEDFVRMLWEQEVEVVVMLTNLIEEGKLKCEQYWPNDDQIDIGEITIKLTTTQIFADYTIRRLQLFKGHGAIKYLTHFHFTTWPDKNVPINAWGLVELEQRIEHVATDNPIVVHCSTGVGRTAIFIALQNALEEIEETDHMDFFTTVQKLRNDRINMIQTSEQYEFLHRETQIALVCKGTTVTSNNIQDRIQTLEKMSATGESNLEKEFKSLCLVCYEKNSCNDGEMISNNLNYSRQIVSRKMKTRLHNALSEDYSTPILESEILSMESCINTVYIPNFRGNNYHLLTQLPLHTTITDFWRLVIHCNVGLVVAFEMIIKNEDTTIGDYLLERDDDDKTTSFFNIKKQSLQSGPNLDVQRVVVTIDREQLSGETNVDFPQFDGEYRLSHIACKNRSFDPESLLELVRHIRSLSPVGERRILYMCRNGAKFSGLVCTMTLLLDRMDNDQHVSVPLVLGSVKAIRPQVVATLDECRLLYKALNLYIERINAYSNVGTTR